MKFNNQPCLALPESPKLRAKQGHAKSTTFAKNFSDQKNNPCRLYPDSVGALRPLREPSPTPHAKSAKASMQERFSKFPFLKFRIPRVSASRNRGAHFAFPNQITPSHPWRPLREPSAFSLTEVVIAMGVAAVAFTSIIALFPLGLNMSKESYEATQAALIAQTIMADLNDALSTKDALGNYAKLIQKGGDTFTFDTQNYTTIALSGNTSSTFYLAYDETVRSNSTLKPILIRPSAFSASLPQWYTDGTNGTFAVVKVIISQTFVLGSSSSSNPQKIDVWVETPGKFRDTNRVQFLFTGVIPAS